MQVGYVYDELMMQHEDPNNNDDNTFVHPEQPNRIKCIYDEICNRGLLNKLIEIPSRIITQKELLLGHTKKYISKLLNIFDVETNDIKIDSLVCEYDDDLYANKNTLQCALLAAGSSINLVDAILTNQITRGVAIIRPPGHHACSNKAMGFCFFNNVALAAIKARNYGFNVAIVDFDIHYGNGTADIVKDEKNITFFSVHRHDLGKFYPKNGNVSKYSNIFNYPLNYIKGTDSDYTQIFNDQIIPQLKSTNPDIILVSAGFDAAFGDPLGKYNVSPSGYRKIIKMLLGVQSRVALILEGGYNLHALSLSVAECVEELLID